MSLDQRLKCEAPTKGPYDGLALTILARAGLGCMGVLSVLACLRLTGV